MKRLRNHWIGIDQGENILFSDYEDGGAMWTGNGAREIRNKVKFSESFRKSPAVHCSLSMWDLDSSTNIRGEISAESITAEDFTLVFRTWSDTRIARARVRWMAIGELRHQDEWDLY
ncbi:H-type lectin domain-containing protein [Pseudooceanicola sp.]|uniref:H-type lectin domain-containing protein n=1 Tax=Pseudooceanicola sp. TaxID=1914328 RepID=UPI002606ABF5|nr:H-type lectin domain-containing protein [Pseudooceanicola sp.]MDF1854463.1 H-type lectin domain-containing protein [Pseudooceanicola sp.]